MITVVGVDGRALSPLARARLEEAAVLAGPDRLLERVRPLPSGARVVGGPLGRAVEVHREHGGRLVVLAAGDPGLFGAVAELRGHGVVPEVVPAPSLVSQAFARAGLAWEDALVVTGERLDRVANACRAHHKVAVLVAPGVGPAEIARELAPTTPRALIVCEDLGGQDERITHSRMGEATTRPWKNPEVVLVLDPLRRSPDEPAWVAGARPGPAGWARDFAGAGLDPVVRAFVLARLGPRLGDLIWDVGAGGGEIAVECALLGAAVVAVEPEEEACARLRRNVIAHGVKVALTRGRRPRPWSPWPTRTPSSSAEEGPRRSRRARSGAPAPWSARSGRPSRPARRWRSSASTATGPRACGSRRPGRPARTAGRRWRKPARTAGRPAGTARATALPAPDRSSSCAPPAVNGRRSSSRDLFGKNRHRISSPVAVA
ncbi:precorrin-6y C5,15-methyltransferase (decarboxylating) subunit CbiE [Planomonospora algeriensis]